MFFEIGETLYNQEEYVKAIYIFEHVLKNEESMELKIGACYYLATIYKNTDEKKRNYYLVKALQYDSKRPEICCELGKDYTDRQQFNKAIPLFLAALNRERPSIDANFFLKEYWDYIPYLELCTCYIQLKEIKKAYIYNELAAIRHPDSLIVQYNRDYFTEAAENQSGKSLLEEKQLIIERRSKYKNVNMEGVSIITVTNKYKFMDMIFANYNRIHYPKKELILILNCNDLKLEDYRKRARQDASIRIYRMEEHITLGECLNYGITLSSYEYIAKMDDDDFYGENYLLDGVIDSKEYNIDVIVKSRRLIFFEQENILGIYSGLGEDTIVIGGAGGTILAKKSIFNKVRFHAVNIAEDEAFFQDCRKAGITVYSGSRFNYIYNRHCSAADHTYVVEDQHFKDYCSLVQLTTSVEEYASV